MWESTSQSVTGPESRREAGRGFQLKTRRLGEEGSPGLRAPEALSAQHMDDFPTELEQGTLTGAVCADLPF